MTVDRTLAAIDAALEPWECDEDAARWHADGDGPDDFADEDEGMRGLSVSYVIYDEVPLFAAGRALTAWGDAVAVNMQEWAASMTRALQPAFNRAADTAGKMIAAAYGFTWAEGKLHYHPEGAPGRVLRRCRVCHPEAFSSRLAINGREYRRRQRARRRRRRDR